MTEDVGSELDLAWRQVTATSSFIGGDSVDRFEKQWAAYCRVRHAVGVANGTDAIELVLRAMGIGRGDEVILPTNTFVATAEAIVLAGATPRFADVDPETLLLTPETIQAAITAQTTAIIAVHLYGNMPEMDGIVQLASRNGLSLIEDAAQAHGSTSNDSVAGSIGAAGCFSFYPSKNLGAFGDAGAVVTNDAHLAARVRSMANHGRSVSSAYVHALVGRNSRLDSLQAAVLSAKLSKLDAWNQARRSAMSIYRRLIEDGPVRVVPGSPGGTYHLNVVRVPHRDQVRARLAAMGIEVGVHYPVPCHLQAPYRQFAAEPLPVAEQAASEVLSLPMFPHITKEQIERVCASLNEVMEEVGSHVH